MKFLRYILVFLLLSTLWFQVTAYKQSEFIKKKTEYTILLEKKVSAKLDEFSEIKLKKLDTLIVQLIWEYEESTSISDNQKLTKLALLYALQEMVWEKLEHPPITITVIDDKKRQALYHQMDSIVMEEAPVIPLFYDKAARFTGKNVEELGINPLNLLTLKRVKKQ